MLKVGYVKLLVTVYIAVMFQSLIVYRLHFQHGTIDLALLTVIFFGLFHGINSGTISGLFSGLLLDSLSSSYFGMNILLFGFIGAAAGFLSEKINKDSIVFQFFMITIFAIIVTRSIQTAIFTALFGVAYFFLLRFVTGYARYYSL